MAITFIKPTIVPRSQSSNYTEVIIEVALDNNYPAGGYEILANMVGLKRIYGVQLLGFKGVASMITILQWSYSTGKLVAMTDANTEETGGADLSLCTARLLVIGV